MPTVSPAALPPYEPIFAKAAQMFRVAETAMLSNWANPNPRIDQVADALDSTQQAVELLSVFSSPKYANLYPPQVEGPANWSIEASKQGVAMLKLMGEQPAMMDAAGADVVRRSLSDARTLVQRAMPIPDAPKA